ncbi:MAG: hypothetical protein C4555_05115 [Dehalococcoidia bacterium]|nr:MAG: hypothetical protein C4555_05115 [Dehalococcoidia bacterium]
MAKIDAHELDRRWKRHAVRSWSEVMDDWAKQTLDEAVARSEADSEGFRALPMQSGSEEIKTPSR